MHALQHFNDRTISPKNHMVAIHSTSGGQTGIAFVSLILPLTIALHVLASIAIILGVYVAEAAFLLALFTLVATLQVHRFWSASGAERLEQSRIALAHLAITGGLLTLAAMGPGRFVL